MKAKGKFDKSELHIAFRSSAAVHASLLLLWLAFQSQAQTYTILRMFGTNTMGLVPHSALVQGADSSLYGTTEQGGAANLGQVFKVNPDGSGYTVIKDFTGNDGADPDATLVLSGTTLYGTTSGGGSNNGWGIVYKVNTDGSGFTVLKDFADGVDGGGPAGQLLLFGTTLFGTTSGGGISNYGTIFRLGADGSGFSVLKYFTGGDGASPFGGLVLSGSVLYGTTSGGGAYNSGTIFRIGVDGKNYSVLKHFTGGSDGGAPYASLVISDNTLYGTTLGGGGYGNGTIFKLNIDGSGFGVLQNFADPAEGANCYADLLLSGGTLYGTATWGGSSNSGTIFKLNTDGSGFSVLKSFTSGADGAFPMAGLLLSGATLYGTTTAGGIRNAGTLFKVGTNGGAYAVITQFVGGDGAYPGGPLLLSGTNCYAVTGEGGAAAQGTVFRINSDGRGYTILKDFTNSLDGAWPNGGLVLSGSTLYGTTEGGGNNGGGAVFKMSLDGSDFSVLHSFSAGLAFPYTNADGCGPNGGLVLSGTTLYGTAGYGGSNACGTVFKLNTDGTDFSVLHTFSAISYSGSIATNADGAWPHGDLCLSGATLYGTAGGGTLGFGTAFRVNTDGSEFSVIKTFNGDDAGYPGSLVLTNETLYGVAATTSNSWHGVIFKLNTDGSGFSILKDFTDDDGGSPWGVTLCGGTLYGTTGNGNGTVFQINTDGSGFSVLKQFTGDDGRGTGTLVLSGTTLFGITGNGGYSDCGVLFSLSLLPGAPSLQQDLQSQVVSANSEAWLSVLASGIPAPAYQWFFNGVPIVGGTNSFLDFTNAQTAQAGVYSVVLTNLYGSVTSALANLTVQDPYINSQPVSQFAQAGETVSFNCDAGGTPPVSFEWFKDGLSLTDSDNVSGAHAATLTLSNVLTTDTGRYSVVLSNVNSSLNSATAILLVQDPSIVLQPWSRSVNVGQLAEFRVLAHGTALSYQWVKDGTLLNDAGIISGAHTATLTLDGVTSTDAGLYSAVVSNSYDTLTSSSASLVVNPAQSYSILHTFTGTSFNGDGGLPQLAELALSGSTLYGTTTYGGRNGAGSVFKLNTNGSGYAVLYSFSPPLGFPPTNSDGWGPLGGLVVSGTTLYGTAQNGGTNNDGTIFKLNTDGSGFSVLKTFNANDSSWPTYSLKLSGETLYGITRDRWGLGTVFKLNTDGSGYQVLHSFESPPCRSADFV
jgi:uncharacterized repeat protein (TIGR03803 family)